jgi:transposase
MTQAYYTKHVLRHHIDHVKKLEARYKRTILFQEDNDNSHGTRSIKNVARELKDASQVSTFTHPPQSPDLNPIEGIWRIIKQRLRGSEWTSVQAFKDDIQAEWTRIDQKSIRKRITEMKWRCQRCIELDGKRIRSKLW